ncbi:hypothetical protein AX17_005977 [Amanita inopinata Kibby_2008]|nr:hypothetical protein AX17_005977 [Amanita inopinata Kibby_2008]
MSEHLCSCRQGCSVSTEQAMEPLESPVPHLLNCKLCPTSSETFQVYEVIAKGKAQISALDTEIQHVQEILQRLKERKNNLITHVTAHEAVIAPIRRIPTEILVEIFKHCLPAWDEASPDPMLAPLLLAQVCERWRAITTFTPILWTSIKLIVESYSVDSATAMAKLWMCGSAQCPVNITVRSHDLASCLAVLKLIIPHSDRWRNVSFMIPYEARELLDSLHGQLSSLESLDISVNGLTNTHDGPMIDHFVSAPRLTKVQHGTRLSPLSLILPWKQLTSYTGYMRAFEMLFLFQFASNLVSADVVLQRNDGQVPTMADACESLEFLTSLHLVLQDRNAIRTLPALPPCPALRDLSIKAYLSNDISWSQTDLNTFLTKSAIQLERLSLDVAILKDHQLLDCLRHAPRLAELNVRDAVGCAITEMVLLELTISGSNCLLPCLKSLRFSGDLDLSDRLLIPMVQSRWRNDLMIGCAPTSKCKTRSLESVTLDYSYGSSHLTPTLVARIQSLKHTGYPIKLQSQGIDIDKCDVFSCRPFL